MADIVVNPFVDPTAPLAPQNLPSASAFGGGGSDAAAGANFGNIGQGVSDLFGAIGDFEEGSAYSKAAQYASQNATITRESMRIQETQAQRQITQTIGAQKADVAGNGLAEQGTALNLLASSRSQGALQKQLIQTQGMVTANGFEQEATAYEGMASASNAAGVGSTINSILSFL